MFLYSSFSCFVSTKMASEASWLCKIIYFMNITLQGREGIVCLRKQICVLGVQTRKKNLENGLKALPFLSLSRKFTEVLPGWAWSGVYIMHCNFTILFAQTSRTSFLFLLSLKPKHQFFGVIWFPSSKEKFLLLLRAREKDNRRSRSSPNFGL